LSSEPEKVYAEMTLKPDLLSALQDNIARRLTPKAVKIRADIEVKCFAYEGIDAIKAALKAGEALSTEAVPIKIRLVAPPLYVVTTNSTDKHGGVELMEKALEVIGAKITELKGEMSVKMKVRFQSFSFDSSPLKPWLIQPRHLFHRFLISYVPTSFTRPH
jgi:translation initiation factor 2 subunit 1